MTEKNEAADQVAEILRCPADSYIDGKFVPAADGKRLKVTDPATESVIANVAEAGVADIENAVNAARRAAETGSWSGMSVAQRSVLLWRVADLIERHSEKFATLETLDNGMPYGFALQGAVPAAIGVFRYYAGWADKITARQTPVSLPGDWHAYTRREPHGVVAQIIPWNMPLVSLAWKLAPALATGNSVVLKSAEQTPLSAILLSRLMDEAGFPPGSVNIVTGLGAIAGAALASHAGVDKISFTGSAEVGRSVVEAAMGNFKKVSLELGGKSPAIVFEDADLERAIPGVAQAIFTNQGEICSAGSRVYVHERIYDEVVEGVTKIATALRVGNGFDPNTEMGPLVSREHFERVNKYIEIGRNEGAKLLCGGQRYGKKGYFLKPTVFAPGHSDMRIMQEEIFGPVLCILPFGPGGFDEVVREANRTKYGLAASVWTRDLATAHRASAALKAGTVWINAHNAIDPSQPFGGFRQSGWGRELGEEALDAYTQVKSVSMCL